MTDWLVSIELHPWSEFLVSDMKTIIRSVVAVAMPMFIHVSAHAEGMCKQDEQVVFNCELKKSTASLCIDKKTRKFVYRNGTRDKMDLQVPARDKGEDANPFQFSNVPYAGGGEAHVRFERGDYNYYLYDKTVKTADGPEMSAGIVVFRQKRKIAEMACQNDASVHQEAYEEMPKETYLDIGTK
ncbi:hypothetical protein [Paraburkholderia azotifigens]|uniref:Uncharacterized protein n=1 Tax=Paraburkholderia azotifigens TaxID=2057004 RepID=A0A5C6VHR8_9BURK|nr:hypothetical protein [Paraburkholderia azotifigens]TXC84687.1 hypothetical protein FRZ40_31155 [Paraburkholderia azotifigens]